ncbi:unannotated protein [freshwater metagenome]|uniref:Unannotated protein n=1 Tax=freshwater metagenome TaxID=449393 RepID=A0A6J6Y6B5_9ZZZZ|nr:hypothetical protein [Actinomycetota bacterium]MSX44814.1 hypothetical protein [Actinomycetota bacterium]MSX73174.1 hypothetical protein [Actinomycetota bacterium]MSZ00690.1 hypothetical protein [Actinomycetota bacterium]MTA59411.1 hypothetical protein [Actinomycetota bacterium]
MERDNKRVRLKQIVQIALLRTKRTTKVRRSASVYESGATAVEFALILPLLLVLIVGLIDFGRMGFVQVSVTAASREGARYSSLYSSGVGSTQTLSDFVQTSAPAAARVAQLDGAGVLTVAITQCSAAQSSENTSVTASTNFKWLLPVGLITLISPGATWLQDFTLTSTGTMRCMN